MPRRANPALEALWRCRLRQQPDSGLTIAQFCKREGVSTASFHAWKRRLALRAAFPGTSSTAGTATAKFVPVIVPPFHETQPRLANELVTIQLPNGSQVLLPFTAGVELVCEVVQAVARATVTREVPSC
jgi:hypothetical protein